MQFVQAIWLWASAGIVIPLIIHLWNVQQGKTRKVGSVSFLIESAKTHSKSLRLSDLLLLILRCLLLIVLAFLISKPFIENRDGFTKEKGWLLIEKQTAREAYHRYTPLIDSLIKAGYSFHYFTKGFPEAQWKDTADANGEESQPGYWAILKELNREVPSKLPVYLFTANRVNNFTKSRPAIGLNLKWYTYPAKDTAISWLQTAYETYTDSIRVVIGHSTPKGSYYTYHTLPRQIDNGRFIIARKQGKIMVTCKDLSPATEKNTVTADTATLTVFIYADKGGNDAAYLKAALDAIKDFTRRRIKTTVVNNPQNIHGKYDWLFWLSDNAIPASLSKSRVLVYEKGKQRDIQSFIVTGDKADELPGGDIPVYKITEAGSTANAWPVWKNGYGEVLLSKKNPYDSIYSFHSHFDPQWNGLVWSTQFPQIMANLIFDTATVQAANPSDIRMIDPQQMQPAVAEQEQVFPKEDQSDKTDLTKLFWILAFLLFLAERWITYQSKRGDLYG